MKKLILILLCLPLFLFPQEERKYERTISLSQFVKELKQAADKGVGYTLESCDITFDTILDKKYLKSNRWSKLGANIEGLRFSTSSMLSIFIVSLLSQMMSV
jgi:hypothetical protein|tara:strand:+ start:454 stop:759 length:306 start_codon:yes stop_codon:yes gene_type:complete